MNTETLEKIYALSNKYEQDLSVSTWTQLKELLKNAPLVLNKDLKKACADFISYPSASHFRRQVALMLVYQHQTL
jgi:hypothetical protein